MDHLVKAIQQERIEQARRVRMVSATRRRRRGTSKVFSIRGAQANAAPACVACPVPSS